MDSQPVVRESPAPIRTVYKRLEKIEAIVPVANEEKISFQDLINEANFWSRSKINPLPKEY